MLNHYPLWKYLILIMLMGIGILYALPNFYGEDPAVQVTGIPGLMITKKILIKVNNLLKKEHIDIKSINLNNNSILIRVINIDMQMKVRELLETYMGNQYIIALNMLPATPKWLAKLHAEPMKLGLDLRGGVQFLIQVDIDTAFSKLQEKYWSTLISKLRNNNLNKIKITKITSSMSGSGIKISFNNSKQRDDGINYILKFNNDFNLKKINNNELEINLNFNRLNEIRTSIINQNMNILRNRVNKLGIADALVQREGRNYIIVEIPGIQDAALAKEILGSTATLEFHLVNQHIEVIHGETLPSNTEIKYTHDGNPVPIYKKIILTGDHIIDSNAARDEFNQPEVNIYLDDEGGFLMSKFTRDNLGQALATLFIEYKDKNKDINLHSRLIKKEAIINIATIQSPLGNHFRITGLTNLTEAHHLAFLLRAGALIAPISIVEESTIGPTLGLQNIKRGIYACVCALIISIIFMIFFYRQFGIIATLALLINLVLIIGIMSLLGATLTMPGIAGIILTIAVAVDANVLINERIKEELNSGLSIQLAIHQGYQQAYSSIIDANLTNVIITIILYYFGKSEIKGFAITTMIGILTSMLSAIIGTRAIVNLLYGGKRLNKLSI
ncbi:MAG: protein translocase subunit SecD [Candidatus Dasytiphilus stammeri]